MSDTKKSASDLAALGGAPAFAEPLHVGRPNIPDRQRLLDRIGDMLDRRWLTNDGPYVGELEAEIARRLEVPHVVAMTNATIALEIAIRALGLGGEVIVPSFTFVATAHALAWQEITPIFCDVRAADHNLDPERVEQAITDKTTGIIGVHLWGRACDIDALEEIARRRRLKLLFDASHAFACEYHGKPIGRFGDAEVFSFHATKLVNCFEGGAVTTNSAELAEKMRFMRNFGFSDYDRVDYLGTNGKMSEAAAAMGLSCLESLEEFLAANARNFDCYAKELRGVPGVRLLDRPRQDRHNDQYVVLEVDAAKCGLTRDQLLRVLHAEGVLARRYFFPGCHKMAPYRSQFPRAAERLPVTEEVVARVLQLPTGTAIREAAARQVAQIIRLAVAHSAEIVQRLDG